MEALPTLPNRNVGECRSGSGLRLGIAGQRCREVVHSGWIVGLVVVDLLDAQLAAQCQRVIAFDPRDGVEILLGDSGANADELCHEGGQSVVRDRQHVGWHARWQPQLLWPVLSVSKSLERKIHPGHACPKFIQQVRPDRRCLTQYEIDALQIVPAQTNFGIRQHASRDGAIGVMAIAHQARCKRMIIVQLLIELDEELPHGAVLGVIRNVVILVGEDARRSPVRQRVEL